MAEQRAEAHDVAERFEAQVDESRHQAQYAQQRFEGLVEQEREQAEDAANRFQERTGTERDKARSDKAHLEAQLQRAQRLEVLGQLAGGVAHDFNNLLAVILNYAAFVAEELAAAPASESMTATGRDVGQIERAAQRATALTRQLLACARREVTRPQILDLNHVVTDIIHLLDRTIGEDVVLHTDLVADVWPVLADTGQIEQILVNLAVNARDAMIGGGTLSIDTANVRVDADVLSTGIPLIEGRYVRLCVGDTGDRYDRRCHRARLRTVLHHQTRRLGNRPGTGHRYGILVQAGGTIDIHSQLGVGTTFTIMLPATNEVAAPVVETPLVQHTHTGGDSFDRRG